LTAALWRLQGQRPRRGRVELPPLRRLQLGHGRGAPSEGKEAIYRELARSGDVRPYPGVQRLMRELKQVGSGIAIASSGPRANVELVIELLSIHGLVDTFVCGEDVERGKPDPQLFLVAAERLAVSPTACAVVEDAVHRIEAATRAGMLAVAVETSNSARVMRAAGADLVVAEVGEISAKELIREVRRRGAAQRDHLGDGDRQSSALTDF